ncbi:MAG: iron ABC transporter permease [Acidimicrobiales bacterium]|nr:MAG: iron ABC transporter permease [Acidimicrobiales bacterium]
MSLRPAIRLLAVTGPLLVLAIFFAWPVVELLVRGFTDDEFSISDVAGSRSLRSVIWFTVWQAMVSTIATLVIAMPLTAVLANVRFRGRRIVRALVTVPFVLPTVVVAGAFIATSNELGVTDGTFSLSRSVFGIIVAHVFFNVAVVARTVGGYWSQLARDDEQAARMLGSGPVRTFLTITLRRLRPSVLAATSIIFLFTFTSFGIVLILGGSRQRTIETEIYRYAINRADFGTAAALSVLQLIAVVALVMANTRLRGRLTTDRITVDRARSPQTNAGRLAAWAVVAVTVGALLVPVAVLLLQALSTAGGYGFDHFRALTDRPPFLTVSPGRTVLNSLLFAAVATAIATVVGGWASFVIAFGRRRWSRLTELGYLLPLGTSAVTLGLGILITFDTGWLDLRGSWIIIPLAQALIGIPFVTRAVAPVLQAIDPTLREAAASMGATPTQIRRDIDLPIARRALLVGAGFAFAISLGEFGATSFVGRDPDRMTVPLAIARLLSQPGDAIRGQAMALSVILMLVTMIVLVVIDRVDQDVLI